MTRAQTNHLRHSQSRQDGRLCSDAGKWKLFELSVVVWASDCICLHFSFLGPRLISVLGRRVLSFLIYMSRSFPISAKAIIKKLTGLKCLSRQFRPPGMFSISGSLALHARDTRQLGDTGQLESRTNDGRMKNTQMGFLVELTQAV